MINEIALYTQIASPILFIIALFSVYRVLASQKDATIQVLKEQIELLKLQLQQAEKNTPDIAVEALSKRLKTVTEELSRLNEDNEASSEKVLEKEHELAIVSQDLGTLRAQIARAEELLADFSCPKCKAPMLSRQFASECVEYQGREIDIDHEQVIYECGLEIMDGKVVSKCGRL